MTRTALTFAALIALPALALAGPALAGPALAGETACWFENGVVVIPAEVMGVAGDYILDTATPHTQIGESLAQAAGYAETALTGPVRLAGAEALETPVAVADLDLRTGALPTPIAGVIGADVLKAYVVDISFAPCRVTLSSPGRALPFRARKSLALTWTADRPVIEATVGDGVRRLKGRFTPGTGADRAIRISDDLAGVTGALKPNELYPYGVLQPRLAALSLAGARTSDLASGLMTAEDPGLTGQIGAPYLARYRLRFDFPAGRLRLAPALPFPR